MTKPSERLAWLREQLDTLFTIMQHSAEPRDRRQLLRRIKVLLDEIDATIGFSSAREREDPPQPPQPPLE
jgi:hypothetical protein